MTTNILSIGQSALAAAQIGLATTGHNIANSGTIGYNRQVVMQGAVAGQAGSYGFVGKGTEVTAVRRVTNAFLTGQVQGALTAKTQLDTYYNQIRRIDNLLADPAAGVSPALQDFFQSLQNLSSQPNGAATRQAVLSSSNALVARMNGLNGQLDEIRAGVNDEIASSVDSINAYARQIGLLNDAIEKAQTAAQGKPPNDLLDQREQLIAQLSKEVRVTVVDQGHSSNVFIGNGQPLVVGSKTFSLAATSSPTDISRTEVAYISNGKVTVLAESALPGGRIGGLFDFRRTTLDTAQNALGRIAITLADKINAQHRLGQTTAGVAGGDLFTLPEPRLSASRNNTGNAIMSVAFADTAQLSGSDYRLQYDGTQYNLTRLSDNRVTSFTTLPHTTDGFTLSGTGTPATSDSFVIQPTINGAARLAVAIKDIGGIAAAAPLRTQAAITNTGSATISPGVVDASFVPDSLNADITLQYSSGAGTLSGFPNVPVTVTVNGSETAYAAGVPVPFAADAQLRFGGMTISLSGAPADGDRFTVSANTGGIGDARNALLMAGLQSAGTMDGGSTHFQGAYAQLVSLVGNKTRELEVTSAAATIYYDQAVAAQQSESGVNLDEEAGNLMRYQQAYQAAGKLMQTAGQLFEILLQLGR